MMLWRTVNDDFKAWAAVFFARAATGAVDRDALLERVTDYASDLADAAEADDIEIPAGIFEQLTLLLDALAARLTTEPAHA